MLFLKKILFFFCAFVSTRAGAQGCSGNSALSSLTINFGGGPNPGPSISNVPSTYQYTNQDCPPEGFYAIRNSTFFCFNSDWHVVPYDHSPNDPVGYFLMVNALMGPSLIYQDTITGLCANLIFEASTWVINFMKESGCGGNGIDPDLTFTVTDMNGSILGQYNTGSIPESQSVEWKQYNFLFTAPANGSVIIKITSIAFNGCGNEFGIDDISFRPCGPNIFASFANTNSQQLTFCVNNPQNVVLNATYNNSFPNPVFQWQVSNDRGFSWTDIPGANNNSYSLTTPASSGEWWYRCIITDASLLNNPGCRFSSNTLKILISTIPSFVQATLYQYGCLGGTTYLMASGGIQFEWTGPNNFYSTEQSPRLDNLSYSHTGTYIVKVTNVGGCSAFDSINLIIYAAPIATLTPVEASICEGDSVQLFAGGSIRYKWSPSSGLSNDTISNPFAKPVSNTIYSVRVYNEYTCYDTASVKITVWKNPKAFAGADKYLRKGKTVQLDGGISGDNISYSWSPPDYLDNPLLIKPKAGPPASSVYRLTVVSNNGCGTSFDEVKVEVIDKLFIPTGFTPNSDGLNDKWEIVTFEDYPKATVEVFNRYGQLIYRGFGNNYVPWDGTFKGKLVMPGVYAYIVRLNNNTAVLKGTITLIR